MVLVPPLSCASSSRFHIITSSLLLRPSFPRTRSSRRSSLERLEDAATVGVELALVMALLTFAPSRRVTARTGPSACVRTPPAPPRGRRLRRRAHASSTARSYKRRRSSRSTTRRPTSTSSSSSSSSYRVADAESARKMALISVALSPFASSAAAACSALSFFAFRSSADGLELDGPRVDPRLRFERVRLRLGHVQLRHLRGEPLLRGRGPAEVLRGVRRRRELDVRHRGDDDAAVGPRPRLPRAVLDERDDLLRVRLADEAVLVDARAARVENRAVVLHAADGLVVRRLLRRGRKPRRRRLLLRGKRLSPPPPRARRLPLVDPTLPRPRAAPPSGTRPERRPTPAAVAPAAARRISASAGVSCASEGEASAPAPDMSRLIRRRRRRGEERRLGGGVVVGPFGGGGVTVVGGGASSTPRSRRRARGRSPRRANRTTFRRRSAGLASARMCSRRPAPRGRRRRRLLRPNVARLREASSAAPSGGLPYATMLTRRLHGAVLLVPDTRRVPRIDVRRRRRARRRRRPPPPVPRRPYAAAPSSHTRRRRRRRPVRVAAGSTIQCRRARGDAGRRPSRRGPPPRSPRRGAGFPSTTRLGAAATRRRTETFERQEKQEVFSFLRGVRRGFLRGGFLDGASGEAQPPAPPVPPDELPSAAAIATRGGGAGGARRLSGERRPAGIRPGRGRRGAGARRREARRSLARRRPRTRLAGLDALRLGSGSRKRSCAPASTVGLGARRGGVEEALRRRGDDRLAEGALDARGGARALERGVRAERGGGVREQGGGGDARDDRGGGRARGAPPRARTRRRSRPEPGRRPRSSRDRPGC